MKQALSFGVAGFTAYVGTVLVMLRVSHRTTPALVVTASSLVVYVTMIAVAASLGRPVLFWPASATYWFLAACFLMGFGAIYKSISLRILLDLLNRPGRADRYEGILNRYVQEESYQRRLSVLQEAGLAIRGAAGYEVTPKGRRLAAVVDALQRLFRIESSG